MSIRSSNINIAYASMSYKYAIKEQHNWKDTILYNEIQCAGTCVGMQFEINSALRKKTTPKFLGNTDRVQIHKRGLYRNNTDLRKMPNITVQPKLLMT